ncbi:2-C-methyl-D-erythritol 2,4-cyclodiphosphate synthase [uncultured Faecalibaculum sp.]|uniref:2-C-methyl-D-erythritol 2,4-cyclodiphosphate synthase n=2 Tax=uncultured Faecalibaculum sp. TaxID=1729681 RepID=UPI0025E2FABA|nr:2-C-methyl-D-erythritol 2,4-cyclodiphosphate synthase [uncultured Faecalibaculum sp.]
MIRIGQSVDIHPLKAGRDLILGGVRISHDKGLDGHSDADVLVHAVAESILGALALGDLGTHFPDTDPAYKGADSLLLLAHTAKLARDCGFRLSNLDATILAEQPKMAPHIPAMRENMARVLNCDVSQISVKATRGEKLGFVGREEGIAAVCVCLMETDR